ncbi:MAG: hypothetical protein KGL19_15510 [Bacteroidota bacterium]|nr:hypothetical protein [Bacteroidota bacterium]
MKTIKMLMIAALTILSVTLFSQTKGVRIDTTKHIVWYTCPMHDTVSMKQPGNCPICGMKLQLSKKEEMKMAQTKTYVCPNHPTEVSNKPGVCSKCGMTLNLSLKEKAKLGYTCPMHPNVKSDKEGKCPNCGMQLTKIKNEN